MQAMSQQQDVTAQNLSHAQKPGYRREVLQFDGIGGPTDIVGPRSSLHTDFKPGTFEYTASPFDVALNGPGFFVIQGPNGPLYTRNGVFQMNAQGQLVTPDGLAVRGSGGPIAIPIGASQIEVLNDGSVVADGNVIDQLAVAAFQNPGDLERVGSSYFQALPNAPTSPIASEFRQGYRELSNTTLVQEMVNMISGARLFDATQRALRQIGETISLNTRPRY
jgi:flagellar basal body rod protein FlgG